MLRMKKTALYLLILSTLAILLLSSCSAREQLEKKDNYDPQTFIINKNATQSILLIHGFGASPWEMQELADYLTNTERTVYNIKLKGHSTTLDDFEESKCSDWYSNVESAIEELKTLNNEIYIIGMSTGADLGLIASTKHKTDGIIAIAPPIILQHQNARLSPILKHFIRYVDIDLEEEEKGHYYNKRPLKAVEELIKCIDLTEQSLKDVTAPVLILQSKNDPTVKPESASFIIDNIKSTQKDVKYYEINKHVLVKSDIKQDIFNEIEKFLNK